MHTFNAIPAVATKMLLKVNLTGKTMLQAATLPAKMERAQLSQLDLWLV